MNETATSNENGSVGPKEPLTARALRRKMLPRRQVYFVRADTLGLIKIGHADCSRTRLSGLQVGSPDKLTLLGFILSEDAEELERDIHRHFRSLHVRGEWFRASRELLEFIRDQARGEDQLREDLRTGLRAAYGAHPLETLALTPQEVNDFCDAEEVERKQKKMGGKVGALIEYKLARGIILTAKEEAAYDAWRGV